MEKNITKKGFAGEKGWYKGNLHCHTTESDGCLTPGGSCKTVSGKRISILVYQ